MTSEANDAFREQMRSQFASGEQHPIARLQHHTASGELEFAKIVAEGVPRSLAEKYVVDFGGYEIKETA